MCLYIYLTGCVCRLQVVGGKLTDSGRLGAFITKVKKGSLADTMGHLKPGDEIISWNKACLQDATFDDVYEIILNSKEDMMVCIWLFTEIIHHIDYTTFSCRTLITKLYCQQELIVPATPKTEFAIEEP